MAIDKKLIHFKTKDKFNEQKDAGNIKETSIVFIKDSNSIYTHNTEYQFIEWSYLIPSYPEGYTGFYTSEGEAFYAADGPFYVKE